MVPNERLAVMLPEPASFSVQLKARAVLQDSEITVQARLGDRAFTKQKLRVRARAARTVNCFDPGRFERFIRESRCWCSGTSQVTVTVSSGSQVLETSTLYLRTTLFKFRFSAGFGTVYRNQT